MNTHTHTHTHRSHACAEASSTHLLSAQRLLLVLLGLHLLLHGLFGRVHSQHVVYRGSHHHDFGTVRDLDVA